eukprot:CAMPEP_0119065776 /NCGR_PEP_ID=MMETSP1178-20130426/8511_1 /TAXON_ID=33656 /ORGANISM="unid sp, Strain CCMP2000" /LENGTH=64 /DNA_ID=CAMNT_0007047325 /DNA_START=40 /DNA_END=234 /DNA_ORIENTATION=-
MTPRHRCLINQLNPQEHADVFCICCPGHQPRSEFAQLRTNAELRELGGVPWSSWPAVEKLVDSL